MSTENFTEFEVKNYFEYPILNSIISPWISIGILIIGLFGNMCSVCVFRKDSFRKKSTFIYLKYLSIIDLFVVLIGLGDFILIYHYGFNIRKVSSRLATFLIYTLTDFSNFILITVSIDRSFGKWSHSKNSHKVILANLICMIVLNLHILIFFDALAESRLIHSYLKFFDSYFFWIDLIIYWLIPLISILICSCIMIKSLFHKQIFNDANDLMTEKRITIALIMLNCLFFCLVSPYVIIRTANHLGIMGNLLTFNTHRIANLISYVNYSLRFFLFIFILPQYRKDFKELFRFF
ncbi:unnamed protein product [Brachionus calyciflorus]|uniref:G-protein coupled receptors family 1 profile domain-containing protein n=1 Tax=Brachionus calyciflorus TaxID=104777 RepID=A0A814AV05_9BILA|nr:unnamed protein product [Brachionus calyciflorus]